MLKSSYTKSRVLALTAVSATAMLLIAACGVGESIDPGTNGDDATQEDSDTGSDAEPAVETTFRLSHVYDAKHPVETCGVPAIQEALEGSGVAIESYPAAQLGTEAESLEQIANGSLDIAVAGPSFLGIWNEDEAVLDASYLFHDVDHFKEVVAGDQIQDIHDATYEDSGLKVASTWYYGTRHITSNKEINNPSDLEGIKIRTPDAPLYLATIRLMGGTGTPMALNEVYTALQQNAIDAQENPIPTIASSGFHEVQDYINLTGHTIQAVHIVTHDGVYDQLDDAGVTAVNEALEAGAEATTQCVIDQEQSILDEWREGDIITINDSVDIAAFSDAVSAGYAAEMPWGELYLEIRGQN